MQVLGKKTPPYESNSRILNAKIAKNNLNYSIFIPELA
jgi:hypothetical protein